MSLPEGQRIALMRINGAKMAGNRYKLIHGGGQSFYREARKSKGVWNVIGKGMSLMSSTVQPLIDAGFVQQHGDGVTILLEPTDKRPDA